MRHLKNSIPLFTFHYLPMKQRIIIGLTGILLALPAFTLAPSHWKLGNAAVTFRIKHAGLTVNGSLSGAETAIEFDAANPAQSTIVASVAAATIESGIALRNKHLRKEQYLHVDKYPRITMRSLKIEKTVNDSYTGDFALTIKEITKKIKVPFTFTEKGDSGEIKGEFSINRLDYGVGESNWLMDNEVVISIQLNVTR